MRCFGVLGVPPVRLASSFACMGVDAEDFARFHGVRIIGTDADVAADGTALRRLTVFVGNVGEGVRCAVQGNDERFQVLDVADCRLVLLDKEYRIGRILIMVQDRRHGEIKVIGAIIKDRNIVKVGMEADKGFVALWITERTQMW